MTRNFNEAEEAGFAVVDIARLMRAEFERRIQDAKFSITPGEARLLLRVSRCEEPARHNDLAAGLEISRMTLTNYVDRLEEAGLLERLPCDEDRRAKRVRLSAAAVPLVDEVKAIARAVRETARADMPPDEWRLFAKLALRVRENLVAARSMEREPVA